MQCSAQRKRELTKMNIFVRIKPTFVSALLIALILLSACAIETGKNDEGNAGASTDAQNSEAGVELSMQESDKIVESGDWLPIGTILMLKKGTQKLMIVGKGMNKYGAEGRIYDYCAVMAPQGMTSPDQIVGFDKDSVERVYFLGYIDEKEEILNLQLEEYINERRGEAS
jgi:hypothetical protein